MQSLLESEKSQVITQMDVKVNLKHTSKVTFIFF